MPQRTSILKDSCAHWLKAMADDTRLKIMGHLFQGPQCGSDIAKKLKLSQPHVAHHLGILKRSKILQTLRQGQKVFYELHPDIHERIATGDQNTIDLGCCKISFQ